MKTENEKSVNKSLIKAITHSIIIPIMIFITMLFIDKSMSLASVIGWYIFTITLYGTTKEKQLTAYIFFNILKGIVTLILLALLLGIN